MVKSFLIMFLLPEIMCMLFAWLWVNSMQEMFLGKSKNLFMDCLFIYIISFPFHILPAMYIVGVLAYLFSWS